MTQKHTEGKVHMPEFLQINDAIHKGSGQVALRGWVYRERGNANLKFITLRDSSNIIQCVIEKGKIGDAKFEAADKIRIETSMKLYGEIKKEERAPTGYEVHVTDFEVVGPCDRFPITKDQSTEFLADNRHLWIRSRHMTAILKIRSTYVQARHEFFQKKGFYEFDPPIFQPNQCEGGSTLFQVKYFTEKTYLSQSWQLYAEAAVFALEKIYDMSPTFRAESSKTSRHLSEFWMAEMEAAWFDLKQVSEFAKEELKFCIGRVIERNSDDLKIVGRDPEHLKKVISMPWPTIKYREALKVLKEKENMDVEFGKDLRTIEEEKLMMHFETPVVVTHYPVEIMAFYKPSDATHPDEALCFDMLAPEGYGEIVGGSERSTDIEDMKNRLAKEGEDISNYDWYFDLRRYGSVPHAGYGVGIERVIRWICKLENIKDAIAFPRTMLRFRP